MALSPEQIETLSKLLDVALDLEPSQRESWIASLSPEEQALAEPLREMLANDDKLAADRRFEQLPPMSQGEEVATKGDMVGPYRLQHEIGRGGMGSVWLAQRADGSFKRQVALKLPRLAWGAGLAERMAREREIGALLEHPAIGRMYDAGVDERGRPYLAFEYIDGQPIDAWCESQALSLRQRLALFQQVIKAVAYAHGRLVVHRDLKPSNVMVTLDGQAHLLDFGIAKLLQEANQIDATVTQAQVLTPHYASPEQIAGEPITVASDVYSLGVLLYELLTGVLPVAPRRETRAAIEEAILEGDTVLASTRVKDKATARALRGELDAILSKAMQRDPQRRYATADALAQDIERYLQGETVSARPDSLVYRMHKAIRRHWVGVSAVTAVLIAVLSGSAVALVQAQRAARASERERVVKEFVADVFRVNSHVTTDHAAVKSASSESLLEGGAQLIQQRFAGQPDMQAELFGVVGGVFSDMGAYKLAADYATHRIEALNLSHADDIEQVQALLALAQALFDDNKLADAEVRLREVLKLSKHEPPLRLNALVLLARLQLGMEHLKEALVTQQELEAQVNSGVAPPIVKAWSVFLRASILEMQNQFDRTLPIYQKAINQALLAEGPLSTTAVSMRLVAVRKIIHYGDVNLAQEYFAAADKALRELGAGHGVRATYEAALFQYMLLQSRAIGPREAMRKILQYRDTLAASELSIPAWYIPECDRMLAMIKMESGDLAGGLPLYESSQALLRKMLGPDNDRRHSATYLGMMMEAAGRHEIADRLLREALEIAKAEGLGLHPYATSEYFWISDNLRMWGRYSEADKFLSAVPKFEKLQGGGPSEGNWSKYLAWERAKLQLDVGNANLSTKILKDNPPEKGDQTDLNWYNQALGEALCSGGQAKEGLSLLKQTVTFLDSLDEYPYSPDYGRLWGDIALCTLATGELKTALLYAEKARVVFKEQPGMSPYFKRPLEQFERQWGTRQGLMKG